MTSGALLLAFALVPRLAAAHGGTRAEAQAELTRPASVGEIADKKYIFSWIDGDATVASESATIEFYYTPQNPPTFIAGVVPPSLEGKIIARGVPVHDTENSYIWDTSQVPPGTYWIWSVIEDPEAAADAKKLVSFSPGVVTIAHPGDEVYPAVVLSKPDNPYRWPTGYSIQLGYEAFDPSQTGSVKLEAWHSPGGIVDNTFPLPIADGLPAGPHGYFQWDTTDLSEGEWIVRVSISDARGMVFSAYDRYFRFVNHPDERDEEELVEESGCTTTETHRGAPSMGDVALLMVIGLGMILRATYRERCRAGRTVRR